MPSSDITVIITVWKRPYLDKQLKSLISQTIAPKAIWILHNENYIDVKSVVDKYLAIYPEIYIIDSDLNLKYFGRFTLCNNIDTFFTLIIDDDIIPSSNWLQICVDNYNKYNAIISCTGRIIRPNNFRPEEVRESELTNGLVKRHFIGDCYNKADYNYSPEDTYVDYGCNSYFFKTSWMKYFWGIWPSTFASGEDIHLSGSLMILKGIPTVVPKQISKGKSGNLNKKFGTDRFSSWMTDDFIDIRQSVFKFLIKKKGWRPLLWKNVQ